jgi:hypothetical protein
MSAAVPSLLQNSASSPLRPYRKQAKRRCDLRQGAPSSGEKCRAAMIHVHTPQGSWWEVGLLSLQDWQVAMQGPGGERFRPRDGITIWCHPASQGGGHLRFATPDEAWQALRDTWPEYARPALPRLVMVPLLPEGA